MGTRSSIKRLPEVVRAEVDRLLADGRYTNVQIAEHLRTLGHPISKSAVHRYSQDFEVLAADIRYAREMATAIGRELEATPDRDEGRMVIESMQALLLRARMQLAQADEIDVESVMKMARSIKDIQAALRLNVETTVKIRKAVLEEAAAAVEKTAAAQGLSAATAAAFRESLLGLQPPKVA